MVEFYYYYYYFFNLNDRSFFIKTQQASSREAIQQSALRNIEMQYNFAVEKVIVLEKQITFLKDGWSDCSNGMDINEKQENSKELSDIKYSIGYVNK